MVWTLFFGVVVLGGLGCLLWFCRYYFNAGGVASRALDLLGKCSNFSYIPNPPPWVLAANCRWGMLSSIGYLHSSRLYSDVSIIDVSNYYVIPNPSGRYSASFHVLVLWFWLLVNRKFNQIWLKKNEMFYFLAGDRVEDKETYDRDKDARNTPKFTYISFVCLKHPPPTHTFALLAPSSWYCSGRLWNLWDTGLRWQR